MCPADRGDSSGSRTCGRQIQTSPTMKIQIRDPEGFRQLLLGLSAKRLRLMTISPLPGPLGDESRVRHRVHPVVNVLVLTFRAHLDATIDCPVEQATTTIMKNFMRVATVGLFVTIVVLAVNVARLALPRIRAQSITVVPYTVVLAETIVAPDGRRLPGPHQMWAVRSDGAVVLKFGSAGTGSRQIRFASGIKVSTNDKRRAKSSVQTPLDDSWVRDPREKCVKTITGFQRSDESASGEVIVNGYRTVQVTQFDASRWYALDYGCALVKHRVDHGELGSSELDLMTLMLKCGRIRPTQGDSRCQIQQHSAKQSLT